MLPSYHLSIETPTPLVLGVGVFAPVTGFVTLCFLVGDSVGTFCVEEYLHCVRCLLALQALFLTFHANCMPIVPEVEQKVYPLSGLD